MNRARYIFYSLMSVSILVQASQVSLLTLYGVEIIQEPLLIDLLAHQAIQRLKYIQQYGLDYYVIKKQDYSRWDHSVGVMVLLKRFQADIIEQAAGLCHDATHTIFSHVGDLVFGELSPHESYQDTFYEPIMRMHGIDQVLEQYGLKIADIDPHNGRFAMLENNLPDLCADRLEYNLQGGYIEGILSSEDIRIILQDLRYEQEKWFFVTPATALLFAKVPLYLSLTVWQSPRGMLVDFLGARLVREALQKNIISIHEVHTATDQAMWQRLCLSQDPNIVHMLYELCQHQQVYVQCTNKDHYQVSFKGKFRGIDPWVKTSEGLQRLTSINKDFAQAFQEAKNQLSQGWFFAHC